MFAATNLYGQTSLSENELAVKSREIKKEGLLLYRLEKASWKGTDLFIEKYSMPIGVGGYFSYPIGNKTRFVFVSNEDDPKIMFSADYDSTFSKETVESNNERRSLSSLEKEYFFLRRKVRDSIVNCPIVKWYQNTNFNIVPIIEKDRHIAYIMTGSKDNGTVYFGNDYLVIFDKNNKIELINKLHEGLIPIDVRPEHLSDSTIGCIHNHLPYYSSFITPTDICTSMLYQYNKNIKQISIVSNKYVSIWNSETTGLVIVPLRRDTKKD